MILSVCLPLRRFSLQLNGEAVPPSVDPEEFETEPVPFEVNHAHVDDYDDGGFGYDNDDVRVHLCHMMLC